MWFAQPLENLPIDFSSASLAQPGGLEMQGVEGLGGVAEVDAEAALALAESAGDFEGSGLEHGIFSAGSSFFVCRGDMGSRRVVNLENETLEQLVEPADFYEASRA